MNPNVEQIIDPRFSSDVMEFVCAERPITPFFRSEKLMSRRRSARRGFCPAREPAPAAQSESGLSAVFCGRGHACPLPALLRSGRLGRGEGPRSGTDLTGLQPAMLGSLAVSDREPRTFGSSPRKPCPDRGPAPLPRHPARTLGLRCWRLPK